MTGGGQIGHALQMIAAAKNRGKCPPVVFGGPHVNVLAEQTLAHAYVDAVLIGPGQSSMPMFVQALMGKQPLTTVPGLLMKDGSGRTCGPTNPPTTQRLGKYPWHLLNVSEYIRNDPTISPKTLNYVSSQGCVYKCRFCYELTYKRKYSAIDDGDLLNDIETLVAEFGVSGIKFYDADWFISRNRVIKFCQGAIERKLNVSWAASINPNDILKARSVNQPILGLLAESGCKRLLMGVESGSDRVLNEIVLKEVTRAQILDVASDIAAHGILGSYTFIIGFPGETESEQAQTFNLIEELWQLKPTPETRVHIFAPYPGTPLFETALRYGFTPPKSLEEWSHYDYYKSQTPWTNSQMAVKAREFTRMTLTPTTN
jgi:radical SAM superfamily enzyme YgiQ (UPF0313 family)